MRKHALIAAMSALAALAMTSCSPYALVNSEVYNDADLAEYHTFHIVTPDQGELPDGMAMVTYYNIAAAIREQLVERGFTEDPASPLLVNIGLTVKKEIDTEPLVPPTVVAPAPVPVYHPMPVPPPGAPGFSPLPGPALVPTFIYPRSYYWPSYYTNARVITGIYREGVLTMDMVNIADKLPLYSASVATILEPGSGQFRNLAGIAEAVQTLFSRFPVPLLPQYKNNK